ncbi:MAG: hypothetical protein H6590_02355 [Flavobacteriales bacterium]|nr:hypothetical protein [Flavobacteriales bacterium]
MSFVLPMGEEKDAFIRSVLVGIVERGVVFQLAVEPAQLEKLICEFVVGYLDDEADPNSTLYNTIQVPLHAEICGKRRAVLHVSRISRRLAVVDVWFYGSELDATEAGMKAIRDQDERSFKDLLVELHDTFRFPVGSVGYEMNSLELFDSEDTWPSESYVLSNIPVSVLSKKLNGSLIMILVDTKTFDLDGSVERLILEQ